MTKKYIVIKLLVATLLLVKISLADYISIGAGITGSANKGTGLALPYIGIGLVSYKKYTPSVSFNGLHVYGLGVNTFGWLNKNIFKDTDGTKIQDRIDKHIDKIAQINLFSAAYLNLEYDAYNKRGFYYFAGVGYGAQASISKQGLSLIKILKTMSDLENLNAQKITEISNDAKFQENLLQAVNYLDDFLKNLYGNDASKLIAQAKILQNNPELINNEAALSAWLTDTKNIANSISGTPSVNKAVQKNILDINQGVAWQFGVGYDIKIIGPLGLDLQAKSQGLFKKTLVPVYTFNANLILKL